MNLVKKCLCLYGVWTVIFCRLWKFRSLQDEHFDLSLPCSLISVPLLRAAGFTKRLVACCETGPYNGDVVDVGHLMPTELPSTICAQNSRLASTCIGIMPTSQRRSTSFRQDSNVYGRIWASVCQAF